MVKPSKGKLPDWNKMSVFEDLKKKIVLQEILPGSSLNEKELMQTYGIGRTPLREALLKLESIQFLQIIPNKGTFVSPMDINKFKSVMEMRAPLEILAVKLAVQRITPKQIQQLEKILSDVENYDITKEDIYKQLMLYEAEFHKVLYNATGNEMLSETLQLLQIIIIRFWMYITNGGQGLAGHFDDLRELLEAIKKKDTKQALKIIEQHIDNTSNLLSITRI